MGGLFCGLNRNPVEFPGINLDKEFISDFTIRIKFKRFFQFYFNDGIIHTIHNGFP